MAMTEPAISDRRDDERYQRLLAATREAARHGYDAVSMRELAESTHMSLSTVYQFFGSKDRLIAEAHLHRMEDIRDRVTRHPPRGRSPKTRVLAVVRAMANEFETNGEFLATLMRAVYSLDPTVGEVRVGAGVAYTEMIDAAIGDDQIADRTAVVATLGNVIGGAVFEWLHHRNAARLRRSLEDAVRVLFR
jgi:AcrR family transcriptional regulator